MMEEDSRRSERLARLALTAVSVLVIGGLIAWGLWRQHTATYVFQGVVGPASVSTGSPGASRISRKLRTSTPITRIAA